MNFELDGQQRAHFRAALQKALQDFGALERFVREECNRRLKDKTAPEAGLDSNVDALLKWAESDAWLMELLEASQHVPSATLKSVAARIAGDLSSRQPLFSAWVESDPLGALFLGKEECFVGREEFRARLRELGDENSRHRVLIVNGRSGGGKSYSYELLRTLDRLSPKNVVALVDFKDFRIGALAQRYRDIVDRINTRLSLRPDELPPLNESETRWFEHAIRKFDNTVADSGRRLWLVFDHIHAQEPVEQRIVEALTSLATYALREGRALRVVLIDVDPVSLKVERAMRGKLKLDNAMLPNKDDVVAFFKDVRKSIEKCAVGDDQIEKAADEVMHHLTTLEPLDQPYALSGATWQRAVGLGLVAN